MGVTANNFIYFSKNVISALLEVLNRICTLVLSIDRNLFRDAPGKHWQTTALLHFAVSFPHLNHFELIELVDRASDCLTCVGHFEVCQAQGVSRLRSNSLKRGGGLLNVSTRRLFVLINWCWSNIDLIRFTESCWAIKQSFLCLSFFILSGDSYKKLFLLLLVYNAIDWVVRASIEGRSLCQFKRRIFHRC